MPEHTMYEQENPMLGPKFNISFLDSCFSDYFFSGNARLPREIFILDCHVKAYFFTFVICCDRSGRVERNIST